MPRRIQIEKKQIWRCDECKRDEILSIETKRTGWISIMSTRSNGLRLFEKMDKVPRYESFNLPNREEKVYCSRECAFVSITKSVDLFISEISPHSVAGLKRKKIEINTN